MTQPHGKRPAKAAKMLTCPNCGKGIPADKYAMAIELGVDGVRDVCPHCKQIVVLDFTPLHGTPKP